MTFSLFGFIIGIWADGFEKLQMIPMLVVTPLTFLGGSFYSVNMLPSGWRTITLLNPVVYLISGFRWSFYEIADVSVGLERRHDARLPRDLHGHGVVDLQDRVSAEELTARVFRSRSRKSQRCQPDFGPAAALFAPWRALTMRRAGHWNQSRIPGILDAGGRRAAALHS